MTAKSIAKFAEALSSVANPPCKRYSCQERQACSDNDLACSSFVAYVRTGRIYPPTAIVPDRVKHSSEIHHTRWPQATNELFKKAMKA